MTSQRIVAGGIAVGVFLFLCMLLVVERTYTAVVQDGLVSGLLSPWEGRVVEPETAPADDGKTEPASRTGRIAWKTEEDARRASAPAAATTVGEPAPASTDTTGERSSNVVATTMQASDAPKQLLDKSVVAMAAPATPFVMRNDDPAARARFKSARDAAWSLLDGVNARVTLKQPVSWTGRDLDVDGVLHASRTRGDELELALIIDDQPKLLTWRAALYVINGATHQVGLHGTVPSSMPVDSARTRSNPVGTMPLHDFRIDADVFGLLMTGPGSDAATVIRGPDEFQNRAAEVLEARLDDGTVQMQVWVDKATGLPVHGRIKGKRSLVVFTLGGIESGHISSLWLADEGAPGSPFIIRKTAMIDEMPSNMTWFYDLAGLVKRDVESGQVK